MPVLRRAARSAGPLLRAQQRPRPLTPGAHQEASTGLDPPLRIDWLAGDLLADGLPGRLGLTILPGKRGPSVRYPGRIYRRDLDVDLAALREAGVRRLILLVEDGELERWGDPAIGNRAAEGGIDVVREPIPDGHAPPDASVMDRILDRVRDARRTGDVAIACMGGVGRTGTVAACALVECGLTADAAIAAVRRVRHPQAVETPAQMRFVATYAQRRRKWADGPAHGTRPVG